MKSSSDRSRVAQAATPQEEKFKVKEAFPQWALVLGAGVLTVFVFSFIFSFMLPESGPERAWWALGQCLVGFLAAATGHVSAFLYAASKTDKFSPFDVFMKPIELWKPTMSLLPKAAWRVWVAAWGLTAILCGAFVVGGLRYDALFEDWGAEKRAGLNVVQEVVAQARKEREGGAGSLEDAMNDFVGEEKKDDIDKLPSEDCLIFGYIVEERGELDSIVVASVVGHSLTYVGRVPAREIPEESRNRLLARMKHLRRRAPFVKADQQITESGKQMNWLEPILMCQVAYSEWDHDHRMVKPRLKRLLADVDEGQQ
jgi:hypothetical protein